MFCDVIYKTVYRGYTSTQRFFEISNFGGAKASETGILKQAKGREEKTRNQTN